MREIEICKPCDNQFISSYFLVPKPNGEQRFVLNLKQLNRFITAKHFKMEDVRMAMKLMSKGCYMGNIDIENAYFLISIKEKSRKYLRFQWNKTLFEFVCLSFGISVAPWIFTKIMKPVVSNLRDIGLLSVVYLDDWLCLGESCSDCLKNIQLTRQKLESFGFLLNIEKSNLIPSTKCQFLS